MFDVSFGELLVIGAVTLVVVGPEKMPKVARTAGMLFGRLQRFVNNVKTDVQRELHASELAQIQQEIEAEAHEIKNTIHQSVSEAQQSLNTIEAEYRASANNNEPEPDTHEFMLSPSPATTELAVDKPASSPRIEPGMNDKQLDLFTEVNVTEPTLPQTATDRR